MTAGCGNQGDGRVVPKGSEGALQELAETYQRLAEGYPTNPLNQPPSERRHFVERVFGDAGYDYAATLFNLAESGLDSGNTLHKDLAQLVLLPTTGLATEDVAKIYNAREMAAIAKLQSASR
jgi:hypothetical protein